MTTTVHDPEVFHGSRHVLASDGDRVQFEDVRPDERTVELDRDEDERGDW